MPCLAITLSRNHWLRLSLSDERQLKPFVEGRLHGFKKIMKPDIADRTAAASDPGGSTGSQFEHARRVGRPLIDSERVRKLLAAGGGIVARDGGIGRPPLPGWSNLLGVLLMRGQTFPKKGYGATANGGTVFALSPMFQFGSLG